MRKLLGSLLTLIFIINSGITILLPLVAQENTMSQGLSDFTVSVIADQQDAISLGEDVTYTIRVINTGKVKVTDVTVVDSSTTLTKVDDWSSFDLAVGEEKVLTGTHTITQADIEAGEVEASISVSGRYEKDYVVYHETKLKVYPEHPHPDLALTVVADKDNKVVENEVITYSMNVKNTGNVKVKDIAITTLLGVVKEGDWSNFDLNPAEEKNFIATYTVSKEDMDKHKLIVNEVRASALSASDWAIAFTQTEDTMNDLKISVLTDKGDHLKANDQLSYTIEIKNEGKDTLSNIHMQATDLEGSEAFVKEGDWSAFDLSPGENKELKAFYTLSQLDVASQQALSHSFKVSAETSSGDILENEATACVQVEVKKPRLMVEMVADKGKDVKVGDNITYFIKVSNVGNSDLSMNAPSMSLMEVDWSSFDLKVNEDKTFMATYTVTQEAIDKGYYLDNKVCVDGGEVTDWALERLYLEDRKADIAVSMVADKARVENKDEIITYTITIKNRGNVTLKDIRVSEAMNTLTKVDDWTAFSLAPDGEKRLRATYTVTQRDEDQSDKLIRDIDVSATTMDGSRLSTSASAQVSVERKMIVLPSKADIEQQDMNVVVEEVNVEEIVPPQSFPTRILTVNEVEEVVEEVKADVSEDKMTEESEAAPVEQTVGAVVSEIVQEVTSITLLDLAMLSIVGAMVGLVSSVAMMKNFYNR